MSNFENFDGDDLFHFDANGELTDMDGNAISLAAYLFGSQSSSPSRPPSPINFSQIIPYTPILLLSPPQAVPALPEPIPTPPSAMVTIATSPQPVPTRKTRA